MTIREIIEKHHKYIRWFFYGDPKANPPNDGLTIEETINAIESELSSLVLDKWKIKSLIQEAWNAGDKNSQDKFGDFLDRAAEAICQSVEHEVMPTIVCLCGSTRFSDAFQKAQLKKTLQGEIVLTIGCNMKSDTEIFGHLPESELTRIKTELNELHKRKIDLADYILVLNVGGYIGESTKSEIDYANKHGKRIEYLESVKEK